MTRVPELTEIRKKREEIHISQRQLAKLCNIRPSFLNMIEKGNSDPSYKVLVKIFQRLESLAQKSQDNLDTAKNICNKELVTAKKTDSIQTILKIMITKEISQIPIIDSSGCIGIVTENSFVKCLKKNDSKKQTAQDAMESPPPSIDTSYKITNDILDLLENSCILVTEKAKLYGIITKIDALGSMLK